MTIAELRDICLSFPSATEDIKWEDHLCFNIGGKMFIITSPDNTPVSASFKTSDETFETLCSLPGFMPAPYLARNKWVLVDSIERLSRKEWVKYVGEAYALISSRLPKKVQAALTSSKSVAKSVPKKKKSPVKKKVTTKKVALKKKK